MRILLIALLAACTTTPAPGPAASSTVQSFDLGMRSAPKLDVLVVRDDSTPMAAYPEIAPTVARVLAETLDDPLNTQPDARVLVTTTAGDGALRQPTTTPAAQPYVALGYDDRYYRISNTPELLDDALGDLLDVPATRAGDLKPLEAARRALDDHPGVFRADAYLAVVTIAASDDASPAAVADYAAALEPYFGDRRGFAFGIYPPPAPRLDAFQASFPDRNDAADIADAAAVEALLRPNRFIFTDLVGPPCIDEPAGPPYECSFTAMYDDGTSESIPLCSEGFDGRCLDLRDDPLYCPEPGLKRVYLHGFVNRYYPRIAGECVM